jgi:CheY-like chemotaxis protein
VKILVADDADDVREMLKIFLEAEGYEVVAAEDGMAAVDAFMRGNFDGVVLDCAMPHMDGLSAAQVVRMLESLKPDARPARLAFLTGHYKSEELARIQGMVGATRFWEKPVDARPFLSDVAAWLNE